MIRRLLLAAAVICSLLGCTADPPAPVAVPEPTQTPRIDCDLIFPAPAPDRD